MSSVLVEVCEVLSVDPHPNADKLDMVTIRGWVTAVQRGQFRKGDKCVYFPPDCCLPQELSDKLGITKYLGTDGRVRATRLRGYPSYGTICKLGQVGLGDLPFGTNVQEQLGVTKWEPRMRAHDGDAALDHPLFHRYTDIENINNFPSLLVSGDEVYITEKLHGTNCRMGYVRSLVSIAEGYDNAFCFVAGSHRLRRKEYDRAGKQSLYWVHFTDSVRELLVTLQTEKNAQSVIVFGEIIGLQKGMRYGCSGGASEFRAFDISVDRQYLDYREKVEWFRKFNITMAPVLYVGPYTKSVVDNHTDGQTELGSNDDFRGREGVVVGLTKEAVRDGMRCILKSISADYLGRNDVEDGH